LMSSCEGTLLALLLLPTPTSGMSAISFPWSLGSVRLFAAPPRDIVRVRFVRSSLNSGDSVQRR
jgi:hypothetical protein